MATPFLDWLLEKVGRGGQLTPQEEAILSRLPNTPMPPERVQALQPNPNESQFLQDFQRNLGTPGIQTPFSPITQAIGAAAGRRIKGPPMVKELVEAGVGVGLDPTTYVGGLGGVKGIAALAGGVAAPIVARPAIEKLPQGARMPAEIGAAVAGAVGAHKVAPKSLAPSGRMLGQAVRAPAYAAMGAVPSGGGKVPKGKPPAKRPVLPEGLNPGRKVPDEPPQASREWLSNEDVKGIEAANLKNAPRLQELEAVFGDRAKADEYFRLERVTESEVPDVTTGATRMKDAAGKLREMESSLAPEKRRLLFGGDEPAPPSHSRWPPSGDEPFFDDLSPPSGMEPPVAPPPTGLPPASGLPPSSPPPQDPLKALTAFIKAAKPANRETAELVHKRRQQQAAMLAESHRGAQTQADVLKAQGALRGDLPVAQFEPPKNALQQPQWDGLFRYVAQSERISPFDKVPAANALSDVQNGKVPTDSQIALLEKVFGQDFATTLREKGRTPAGKVLDTALDVLNVPRSVQTSFDVSATLRQGSWFSTTHPKEFAGAFKEQIKALGSEKAAKVVDETLQTGAASDVRSQAGLYHAPLDGMLGQREEAFMSKLTEKIPGVKQSGRAYVTFLNKLRADTFDTIVESWKADGRKTTDIDLKELAKYINRASGRGGLGPLENHGKVLSTIFYSPRFATSRFEIAASMLSKSAPVRQQAWRDFGLYVGPRVSLLAMLAASGVATVEWDPRSSDFAKVRMGGVRIDPWGGWQPVVRYMTQAATNRRTSLSTGQTSDVGGNWWKGLFDTLGQFTRSKLAPAPGIAVNVVTGKDFAGEPVTPKGEAAKALVPLVAQDIYKVAKDYGLPAGVAAGGAAGIGLGVQSFKGTPPEWEKDTVGYFALPSNATEAKAKKVPSRAEYRIKNPEVYAKLFIQGQVTSLSTVAARTAAVRLMKENKLSVSDIRGMEQEEFESAEKKELRRYLQRQLGEPVTTPTPPKPKVEPTSTPTRKAA